MMESDDFKKSIQTIQESAAKPVSSSAQLNLKLDGIIQEIQNFRQAAELNKFLGHEFNQVIDGFQSLIDKLNKTARGLNPQDTQRAEIEKVASILEDYKIDIKESLHALGKLSI